MRSRKRGMSLLELLVGLALLTAISTALLSATGLGVRSLERAQQSATYDGSTLTRLQLRRWLRSAASPALLTSIDTSFVGTDQGFEFTSLLPSGHALDAAALRISVTSRNQNLVVKINELDDQNEVIASLERDMFLGETSANILYLLNHEDGPTWVNTWDAELELPLAVKIDSLESRSWPLFLVKLAHTRS